MMPDVAKTKISNKLGRLENEEEQIKIDGRKQIKAKSRMLKKRRVAVILYRLALP